MHTSLRAVLFKKKQGLTFKIRVFLEIAKTFKTLIRGQARLVGLPVQSKKCNNNNKKSTHSSFSNVFFKGDTVAA